MDVCQSNVRRAEDAHLTDAVRIGSGRLLGKKLFDAFGHDPLTARLLPIQFTVPPVANSTFLVDKVHARPHRVAPSVPNRAVIVGNDRKSKALVDYFFLQSFDLTFCRRFGRMNAKNYQALITKTVIPTPVPGVIAYAVNSAKCPEVEGNDLSF